MAIFGDRYDANHTLIYRGNSVDSAMNYVFGIVCLGLFVISTIANPMVFCYHRRIKQTLSAMLFQILTFNDFLTCLLAGPSLAYFFFSEVRITGVNMYARYRYYTF